MEGYKRAYPAPHRRGELGWLALVGGPPPKAVAAAFEVL
jgi:hypothetical protein